MARKTISKDENGHLFYSTGGRPGADSTTSKTVYHHELNGLGFNGPAREVKGLKYDTESGKIEKSSPDK